MNLSDLLADKPPVRDRLYFASLLEQAANVLTAQTPRKGRSK